jgi:selenide,water dikinase
MDDAQHKTALSALATCGGCAAKMSRGELQAILAAGRGRTRPPESRLLVGTETADDAAVYALREDQALVLTTDFITPVCDHPYVYGQVAAANALSDVFAMGGRPLVALAICAFPEALDPDDAAAICAGGEDKAAEAGALVGGGHTVRNPQLLYGLAVTGEVHPRAVVRNVGAQVGDALVLTKPLGTGLLINGFRAGKLAAESLLAVCRGGMATLNARAAQAMVAHGAHAATDVTGFGLAGHALGMARGSGVALRLSAEAFPLYEGALALLEAGVTSRGATSNRAAFEGQVKWRGDAPVPRELLVFDPQTSGGLLVALPPAAARSFVDELGAEGLSATVIGEVLDPFPGAPPLRFG